MIIATEDAKKAIKPGPVGNYYGGLNILEQEEKYYWSIETYDGDEWTEIRKDAYLMLLKGIEVETVK